MPIYRAIPSPVSPFFTSSAAWAHSTASAALGAETWYASRSSFSACFGLLPASMARVGSFTGRTPVRAPQGSPRPSRAVPAL